MINLKEKPFFLSEKEEEWVNETINKLSMDEKIGQLFIVLGDLYSPLDLERMVKDKAIGGILFRPDTLNNIQKKYDYLDSIVKIPLIKVANLEEGGNGAIIDGTRFSTEMGIGATGNPVNAYHLGIVAGFEGRKSHINATFSPDVDIDYNCFNPITNERTFGSSPDLVKEMSLALLKGLDDTGMISFMKHFPGDGTDFRDQHLLPSYNLLSSKDWFNSYGLVYQSLIDAGIKGVMVGHITSYNLEKEFHPEMEVKDALPATLSKTILKNLLREKLHFNGLIVSDATIMGGYDAAMERRIAIPTSIENGIDMLVFNLDLNEDISYVKDGIKSGILTEKRLNEAVMRILAIKAIIQRPKPIDVKVNTAVWQDKLIDESITFIKNNDHVIPIDHHKYQRVELRVLGNDETIDGSMSDIAANCFKKNGFKVSRFNADQENLHGTKELDHQKLIVYLANMETASNQTSVRINWNKKHALDSPRFVNEIDYIFISFANPYHLIDVPRIRTFINSYTANKKVIEATIDKILGKSDFKGTSPVDPFVGLLDTHL